jgi:thiamine-phosphate pyrophosphorylase
MMRREEVVRIARAAIRAGVDWVQIREKDLPTQTLLEMARQIVAAAEGSTAKILVNDRLDVALTVGAAGVHLGGESMPVAAARKLSAEVLGTAQAFLVGRSCHSLEEAQQAEHDGADYLFFGPVFATPSKAQYGPPQGVERLAEVCRSAGVPVIAIGGIGPDTAAKCFRAGAAGIAAIRLFQEATDLADVVRRLRS